MRLAFEFDGVLTTGVGPAVLRPEAVYGLRGLLAAGHTVVVHSKRLVPPEASGLLDEREPDEDDRIEYDRGIEELRRLLSMVQLLDHVVIWDRPGKPDCDWFFDTQAWQVGPSPESWARISESFGRLPGR